MALKAEKSGSGVVLSGTIDDGDDLGAVIGTLSSGATVNCKGIDRINSVGVKNWIKFFSKLSCSFEEMSPILVEQMNSIANFVGGGTVVSVIAPYKAKNGQALKVTLKVEALAPGQDPPPVNGPDGQPAEFDDVPEEYFAFLSK